MIILTICVTILRRLRDLVVHALGLVKGWTLFDPHLDSCPEQKCLFGYLVQISPESKYNADMTEFIHNMSLYTKNCKKKKKMVDLLCIPIPTSFITI